MHPKNYRSYEEFERDELWSNDLNGSSYHQEEQLHDSLGIDEDGDDTKELDFG